MELEPAKFKSVGSQTDVMFKNVQQNLPKPSNKYVFMLINFLKDL